jgi:hypothetical protein
MLGLLPLLVSCASVKKEIVCPIPPEIAKEPLEQNYQEKMQNFLQGLLPQQTKQ